MSEIANDSQPPAAGARCGVHPERPAFGVCRRCGNYMCQACNSGGRFLYCPGCRTRVGLGSFPLGRDSWSFDALAGHCFATWRDHAVTLGLATLIFFSLVFGMSFAITFAQALAQLDEVGAIALSAVTQVVQTVLQVGLQIGLFSMCFEAVEGRPPDLGNFMLGFRKLPAALLQLLLFYAGFALVGGTVVAVAWLVSGDLLSEQAFWIYGGAFVVLLFPLCYVGLGLAFAMFELAHNPRATGLGAIATSWRTVEGERWSVLGVAIVSGIISMVGMLACCVGMLASYPLGLMFMCALYLTLKNPTAAAPAPPPATAEPSGDVEPPPAPAVAPPDDAEPGTDA